MPAPQPSHAAQIQMQFTVGWRYDVGAGEPPRIYDAGSRYYMKVPVARQAYLAGVAKPVEPYEVIGVDDAAALVKAWEGEAAIAKKAEQEERAKLDVEQTRAREAAAAATQPPQPAPAAAPEEA